MDPKTDPKPAQGAEIWQRLEALRRRLEAASAAFDELYAYVYTLKAEHRRRSERAIADLTKRRDSDQKR